MLLWWTLRVPVGNLHDTIILGKGRRSMIDPHVHLRDWNEREKETILHGMESGYLAGIDTFFDMPNTNPPLTNKENVLRRIEDGIKAEEELKRKGMDVHYHLYLGLTPDEKEIGEMVSLYSSLFPRVVGLKLFASHSTGNMGIIDEDSQKFIFDTLSRLDYKGVLVVHSEKTSCFIENSSHALSRPSISEIESVRDMIEFATASSFKGTLHIAHISTKGALELVKEAKKEGKIKITCGATPHHALFNMESENYLLKMNPPLREEEDRSAIFSSLLSGDIDWIESDHAPHTLEDKKNRKCGIPGFKGTLMLIDALRKNGISEDRLESLLNTNIASVFGIGKSRLSLPDITEEIIEMVGKRYPFDPYTL